ncbi:hypothetical protein EYZ11_003137 [Aspergillus tanneri]|uniref:Uncharacterized protein n=1 Tax=Aspergillus tanneri TaxID=1220188 RepID=A0A4V3UQ78_9EURO|nr:uncharacterized protein ATNIH1004_001775 [Aspergillus tanneri]KAA8652866.1 hypothetical protein ATNIH1004_001775 [Aspergillus tanneri]THC97364.1 hypothetical protein EYZ11_003137 [Aspergillus tanneri]
MKFSEDSSDLAGSSGFPQSVLQQLIDEISHYDLEDAIRAIVELVPDLKTSISPAGMRLITHPAYDGFGNLDTLGRLYLQCGSRCTAQHATFDTRLLHATLDPIMASLYNASEDERRSGINAGTIILPAVSERGCACCRGDPDALILAGFVYNEALFFEEEEYRRFWGDEESVGTMYQWNDGVRSRPWLQASKEQVERIRQQNVAPGIQATT